MENFSDFTLFGVMLAPFIMGLIALLRNETQLSDYVLDWLGALLYALVGVLSIEAVETVLAGGASFSSLMNGPIILQIATVFFGILFSVKGYWPTVRARVRPKDGDDFGALHVNKGVFRGKY